MTSLGDFWQITRDAAIFAVRQYFWPITAGRAWLKSLFAHDSPHSVPTRVEAQSQSQPEKSAESRAP